MAFLLTAHFDLAIIIDLLIFAPIGFSKAIVVHQDMSYGTVVRIVFGYQLIDVTAVDHVVIENGYALLNIKTWSMGKSRWPVAKYSLAVAHFLHFISSPPLLWNIYSSSIDYASFYQLIIAIFFSRGFCSPLCQLFH